MKKSYHLIANWKMNLTFNQASSLSKQFSDFVDQNNFFLENIQCVLCPSFEALISISQTIKNSSLRLGAQSASLHSAGNFTGEVSAQSLQEVGCTYCIVGHSERRIYNHESEEIIGSITQNVLQAGLIPIFCIGETEKEREEQQTLQVLKKQLATLFSAIKTSSLQLSQCIIAYEPVWSIGTNKIPSQEDLHEIFGFINREALHYSDAVEWTLLYGGGVSEQTLPSLLSINLINGFLVGRASTHLQQLESMIQHIRKFI